MSNKPINTQLTAKMLGRDKKSISRSVAVLLKK
jgi:hypothetical protein